jgi:DNA-binding SARP family transcriptional activator/TolB-like protein
MSTASTQDDPAIRTRRPQRSRSLGLSLFGTFEASFGGRQVSLRSRKAAALLGYIALSDSGAETRERLVGLLWSESEEARARGSLRQTLRELRQAFDVVGYGGMRADKTIVALDREHLAVDLWQVVREAEEHRAHPLLLNSVRPMDGLLGGLEDLDPGYRIWLLARRQALQDRLIRALEGGLADAAAASRETIQMAEAILNLDPTHEEACRYVMQARAEAGDIAAALRAYKGLWDLLDADYGMEPSAQSQTLVAKIKSGDFDPPAIAGNRLDPEPDVPAARRSAVAPMPAPALPRAPRLVLSIEPTAADAVGADHAPIVSAFRHHLIACLAKFREWHVVERAAGPDVNAAESSGAARYHLQTTVYPGAGPTLNLILSLKEAQTGHHIWSDRLKLSAGNMFDLQQRIVQRITVSLNIQLSAERLVRLAGQPNLPRELYDSWLLSQELMAKRRPIDWEHATAILRSLMSEAPGFGPAYSSLVQLRNAMHIVHPGVFRTAAGQRETLTLAKTAAQLDPIDSRAQLCLGWAYAFDDQFEQALLHFGLACDLNDTDPWTLVSSAHAHAFAGHFDAAKELAERALHVALVPTLIHWAYRAAMHFMWGDYRGCIDAANRSLDSAALTPMWRTAALALLGEKAEARKEGARFLGFVRSQWQGGAAPANAEAGRWIMHLFPIHRAADWERLRDALVVAGLPVGGTSHQKW